MNSSILNETDGPSEQTDSASAASGGRAAHPIAPSHPMTDRPPPSAAKILIPVWGESYIQQFVDLSLPTLLAQGNIPAVAAQVPCEIVFLTSRADTDRLLSAPSIRRLQTLCLVSVLTIDDLIVPGLHPLTITLAYARAIRATGDAARETCFFLLVSDYVVADGSLRHVLSLMMAGKSAVQAGNFRMIDTDWPDAPALPYVDGVLPLPPRTLARMALAHLHPKTVANIVDFALCRNDDCNQVFWRAGPDTLIGRFFLLHPICVRPERSDFVVGGFVDYSFVPEMSTPERIATITDSDDYLVVELQAADHEAGTIRFGSLTVRDLGEHLSEWTTAHHRRNADATIVYHADELPSDLPRIVSRSDTFIATLRQQLSPAPQPHRGHPYWYGTLARYQALVGRAPADLTETDMPPDAATLGARGRLVVLRQRLRRWLIGQFPNVGIANPLWPDLHRPMERLAEACGAPDRSILTAGAPPELNAWIAHRCRCRWLRDDGAQEDQTGRLADQNILADDCLVYVDTEVTDIARAWIRATMTALRPGGRLFVLILNGAPQGVGMALPDPRVGFVSDLEHHASDIEELRFVPASRLRGWIARNQQRSTGDTLSEARRANVFARVRAMCLLLLSATVNAWAARLSGAALTSQRPSSIFIVARRADDPHTTQITGP